MVLSVIIKHVSVERTSAYSPSEYNEHTVLLIHTMDRCLPLAASAGLNLCPPSFSYELFSISGALCFLPGFSKLLFLSSNSSIIDSTEPWLLVLLLNECTLPFPLWRLPGDEAEDGQRKGLEPVLLRPDGNVIDSYYI